MPRPESAPAKKPSFVQRVLSFFGFGKKKEEQKPRHNEKKAPKSNTRIAKGRNANQGGNPGAPRKRNRATSTPPTRNGRLYVGNLSYEATESELEELFKGFGHVRSVEVIYNPRTYKSKGYAFVEMVRLEDACRAAEVLHGQPFMGRELMVSAASERTTAGAETETPEAAETTVTPAAEETPETPAPEAPAAPAEEQPAETPEA